MSTTRTEEVFRELPCALTEDELRERGAELAKTVRLIAETDQERKDRAAEYRGTLKGLRGDEARLAEAVQSGVEMRNVKTEVLKDWYRCTVTQTRIDTGEIVAQRAMTPEEKANPPLPLEEPKGEAKKASRAKEVVQ